MPESRLWARLRVSEQVKDQRVKKVIEFLQHGKLPEDRTRAHKFALQESLFAIIDGILYYVDPKRQNRKRVVVPKQLQRQVLEETHAGPFAGHFSGQRLFSYLMLHWWWEGTFGDSVEFAKACPECALMVGTGRRTKHPKLVKHPFQILGIDVMDLPLTERGSRHAVLVQDMFTKRSFVFAVPDQKASRIV